MLIFMKYLSILICAGIVVVFQEEYPNIGELLGNDHITSCSF